MYIRKYKENDADKILSWIENERDFRLWSADRYETYPITANDVNSNYRQCSELGNFYPMLVFIKLTLKKMRMCLKMKVGIA